MKIFNYNSGNFRHNINRLMLYGCSITAGSELADNLLLPHLSVEEIDSLKRKIGHIKFNETYLNSTKYIELDTIARTKSWAAKLANKMELPFINHSVVGNSFQGILWDIETDLSNNLITEQDLLIVGITSVERFLYFPNGKDTICIGYNYQWETEFYNKFVEMIFNDEYMVSNFIMQLKYLYYLRKFLKDRLLFVFTLINPFEDQSYLNQFRQFHSYDFIKELYTSKDLGLLSSISFHSIIGNFVENLQDLHGFYHPKEYIHERLADIYYQNIIKYE